MLTSADKFRPGKSAIWVILCAESELEVQNVEITHLTPTIREIYPYKAYSLFFLFLLLNLLFNCVRLFFSEPGEQITNKVKHIFPDILTWMGDFRPRRLTIWVVFDVESESDVQNA